MPRFAFYIAHEVESGIEIPECDNCYNCSFDLQDMDGENDKVCEYCFEEDAVCCHRCRLYFYSENTNDFNSRRFCDDCLSEISFICQGCRERCNHDNYGGDGECIDCHEPESDSEDNSYVHDSEVKAPLIFHGKGPLFLGVELEVENKVGYDFESTCHNAFLKTGNFAILKEDGSLDEGFEIVTSPGDLAHHRSFWYNTLDGIKEDVRITSDCGLHVHASRDALSALDIAKILYFINSPLNKDFIKAIAGRYGIFYASPITISDVAPCALSNATPRYSTVNLLNDDTVEFRLFASTLNADCLIMRLEFVSALCNFVKMRSYANMEDIKAFVAYVNKEKATYPILNSYLKTEILTEIYEQASL